jgi:hypothetical protein
MVCTLFLGPPAVGDSGSDLSFTPMEGLNESDDRWKKATNSHEESAAMGRPPDNADGKEKMGNRFLLKFSCERSVRWRRCKIQLETVVLKVFHF